MIVVRWNEGLVAWFAPTVVEIDGGEERVRRVLSQPARVQEPVVFTDPPGNGMVEVILKPGDGERHARAALKRLPGAVVEVDDGA